MLLVRALVISCALTLVGSSAVAAPTDAQRALDLAYRADELFAKGKWVEAFDRFNDADQLAHSPVFVLYMARSKRNAGELVASVEIYRRVADEKLAKDSPAPFRAAVSDASSELAEVRDKIPRVKVEVRHAPPGKVEITIDDKATAAGEVVSLDPGPHVFKAATGTNETHQRVDLAAGSGETAVALDFAAPTKSDVPVAKKRRTGLAPGIAVMSLGVASVEVGAITGGVAAKRTSDIKAHCVGNHCLKSDAGALDSARLLANVSTGTLIAGGVLAATGAVLLAVRPGHDAAPKVGVGPGSVTLFGSF